MIMCVLLFICRSYYQQGVLFLVLSITILSDILSEIKSHSTSRIVKSILEIDKLYSLYPIALCAV